MAESEYVVVSKKIYFAMIEPSGLGEAHDDAEAEQNAHAEWADDSCRTQRMPASRFGDALFELADLWTASIDAVEYSAFLWKLFHRVAEGQPPDSYFWRKNADIEFDGSYSSPKKLRPDTTPPATRLDELRLGGKSPHSPLRRGRPCDSEDDLVLLGAAHLERRRPQSARSPTKQSKLIRPPGAPPRAPPSSPTMEPIVLVHPQVPPPVSAAAHPPAGSDAHRPSRPLHEHAARGVQPRPRTGRASSLDLGRPPQLPGAPPPTRPLTAIATARSATAKPRTPAREAHWAALSTTLFALDTEGMERSPLAEVSLVREAVRRPNGRKYFARRDALMAHKAPRSPRRAGSAAPGGRTVARLAVASATASRHASYNPSLALTPHQRRLLHGDDSCAPPSYTPMAPMAMRPLVGVCAARRAVGLRGGDRERSRG